MVAEARGPKVLSSSEEANGVLQVVAATLIAVTLVESIMIVVNRSPLPSPFRLQFVRFGEWLFVPAFAWVGVTARRLGSRSFLPLAGSFATAYMFVTQFRGSWIWSGTFDNFMYPASSWMLAWVIGILCAMSIALCFPARSTPSTSQSKLFLTALAIATAASAYFPRWWPKESVFAATRPLALIGALISLIVLLVYAKGEE